MPQRPLLQSMVKMLLETPGCAETTNAASLVSSPTKRLIEPCSSCRDRRVSGRSYARRLRNAIGRASPVGFRLRTLMYDAFLTCKLKRRRANTSSLSTGRPSTEHATTSKPCSCDNSSSPCGPMHRRSCPTALPDPIFSRPHAEDPF